MGNARYDKSYLAQYYIAPESKIKERLASALVNANKNPKTNDDLLRIVKEKHLVHVLLNILRAIQ